MPKNEMYHKIHCPVKIIDSKITSHPLNGQLTLITEFKIEVHFAGIQSNLNGVEYFILINQ